MVTTRGGSSRSSWGASRSPDEMNLRFGTLVGLFGCVPVGIVAGWLFGLPELTALSVALGTVGLTSLLHLVAGPPVPRLDATVAPPAVTRGDTARLTLRFACTGPSRSRPVRVSGTFGTAGRGSVAVGALPVGHPMQVTMDLPTPHRGVVRFGPLHMHASDPLLVWKRTTSRSLDVVLVIRPRVHPLPGLFGRGGVRVGEGDPTAAVRGGPDAEVDLVGLRPYVPGDDVRRIHWRTSARRNEPHVVEVEPPVGPSSVVVIVDTRAGSCDPDRFELVVEAAASICSAACDAGRPLKLATTAGTESRFPATEQGLSDVLDSLARIEQGNTPGPGPLLDRIDAPATQVVICTGSPEVMHDPTMAEGPLLVCWDGSAPLKDAIGHQAPRGLAAGRGGPG